MPFLATLAWSQETVLRPLVALFMLSVSSQSRYPVLLCLCRVSGVVGGVRGDEVATEGERGAERRALESDRDYRRQIHTN